MVAPERDRGAGWKHTAAAPTTGHDADFVLAATPRRGLELLLVLPFVTDAAAVLSSANVRKRR